MEEEVGRIADGDRAGRASPEPASSLGHSAAIPCAWRPIETLAEHQEVLVCVTYNVPGEEDWEWETVMWTDWFNNEHGWFRYPRLIEIPCPPTHWMPLPEPPHE